MTLTDDGLEEMNRLFFAKYIGANFTRELNKELKNEILDSFENSFAHAMEHNEKTANFLANVFLQNLFGEETAETFKRACGNKLAEVIQPNIKVLPVTINGDSLFADIFWSEGFKKLWKSFYVETEDLQIDEEEYWHVSEMQVFLLVALRIYELYLKSFDDSWKRYINYPWANIWDRYMYYIDGYDTENGKDIKEAITKRILNGKKYFDEIENYFTQNKRNDDV